MANLVVNASVHAVVRLPFFRESRLANKIKGGERFGFFRAIFFPAPTA
jgi:hypothetical protein